MNDHAPRALSLMKLAHAEHTAGRFVTAEAAYRKMLALDPRHADTHYNLGLVLQNTFRLEEAESHYRQSLALASSARAWNNLGNVMRDVRRWDDAILAFERALALQPDHHHARVNLALALLAAGRYAQAWPLYESRLVTYSILPRLACPRWRGESLAGRRLLLVCEQGYGDAVQFIRYAPLLRELGAAQVSVLSRPAIAPLLTTCDGVDRVIEADDGSHDVYVPLLSLPLHFRTTLASIPSRQPYLRAEGTRLEAWRSRLPPAGRRVGVAWRGNAGHPNDARRSLRLEQLRPLWGVPGVSFVSLQKGAGEQEAADFNLPLAALGAQVQDFADLAALVQELDLVICVDTAVAHVAAALGKPCWILLPAYGCDWRWFGAGNGAAAPWYPSGVQLVHQPAGGDWTPALHALAVRLLGFFET